MDFCLFCRFESKERFLSLSSVLEQQSHQLNAWPTPTQVSVGPGPWKHNSFCPHDSVNSAGWLPVGIAASYSYRVDRDLADVGKSENFSVLEHLTQRPRWMCLFVLSCHNSPPKGLGSSQGQGSHGRTHEFFSFSSPVFSLCLFYISFCLQIWCNSRTEKSRRFHLY